LPIADWLKNKNAKKSLENIFWNFVTNQKIVVKGTQNDKNCQFEGYATLVWHYIGEIYWKLRAHEKNRKCLFVDLSLILRKTASQIIFDQNTIRNSMFTRRHFQNCKVYLLQNWAPIFTDHVTVVCQSFKTTFF
jgi:hypothetical protein